MSPLSTRLSLFLVRGGASLLIIASALLGAFYGYVVGSHTHQAVGIIFAAAALGGEVLKPYAVAAALDAFGRWQFLRGAACALLAVVAVVYSVTSELGLAAASRGDHVAARRAIHDDAQSAKTARDRAQTELAALAPARDGLEAQIRTLKATPGANGCAKIDGPISRDACKTAAELEIEAARAKRRAELEAAIRSAPVATEGQLAVAEADPLASALAAYLGALGFSFEPDWLSPWLLLVPVLFLELGSALGVVVVRSMDAGVSGNDPPKVSGPSTIDPVGPSVRPDQAPDDRNPLKPVIFDTQQSPKADTNSPPTDAVKRTRKRTAAKRKPRTPPKGPTGPKGGQRRPHSNVVRLLQRNGGRLAGGQRGIAKSLGMSRTRTNEVLHELRDSGVVRLSTGRSGTVVSLSAA